MSHSNTHQFRLRVHESLKSTLEALAWANKRSIAAEVIDRISGSDFSDVTEVAIPPKKLLIGEKVIFGFRISNDLLEDIRVCADEVGSGMTAEILRRLYITNPSADYEILKSKERASSAVSSIKGNKPYPKKSLDQNLKTGEPASTKTQGLCTQTEDERIMLEKYRALSEDQRTQMHAISDTFHEPKKIHVKK